VVFFLLQGDFKAMEAFEERDRRIAKDELNTIEFPISLPCHRPPKGRSTILITEEGKDAQGRPVSRQWKVEGLKGLPLAIDEEVLLGLSHLLYRQGFKERHVYFTQHSFLQLLNWSTGRAEYKRLRQSLNRLRGVNIESRGIFWDHKGKCRVTDSFNLIDGYSLYERDSADHDQPFISRVSFSDFMFQSFQAGYIKSLDLDFYLSLKHPIARKLFRYLDKQSYQAQIFDIDLTRLMEKLAITDIAYPSKIKQKLEASHKELLDRGFLDRVFYIRRGRSPAVRYKMAPRDTWVKGSRPSTRPLQVNEHPLTRELITRGITRTVARSLLAAHGEKSIADKLEVFDHLRSQESPMLSKNPAGFLRSSIEKDFAPPADYISRVERQRRKDEELAARQLQEDAAQHEEKQRADKRAQLDALWESLTTEERSDLEIKAFERLNPFARKNYRQEKDAGHRGSGHYTLRAELDVLLATQYLGLSEDPSSGAHPIPAQPAFSAGQEP